MLGGPSFDFGKSRDKLNAATRRREVVDVEKLETFLKKYNISTNIDDFESALLSGLFQYAPDGVLLGSSESGIHLRDYAAQDYRIIASLIFKDPVGSSEQHVHEDVAGCDRDAIWNLYYTVEFERVRNHGGDHLQSWWRKQDECWRRHHVGCLLASSGGWATRRRMNECFCISCLHRTGWYCLTHRLPTGTALPNMWWTTF